MVFENRTLRRKRRVTTCDTHCSGLPCSIWFCSCRRFGLSRADCRSADWAMVVPAQPWPCRTLSNPPPRAHHPCRTEIMLIVRSPVRVSFGGGGTDLPSYYEKYGGAVLSAAINKYFYTVLTKRTDDRIQVISADLRIIETWQDIAC